jgi:hypothetical protein
MRRSTEIARTLCDVRQTSVCRLVDEPYSERNDKLKFVEQALLACVYFLFGAVGVSAQTRDVANLISGRIVLIEPKGALKVKQTKQVRAINATEGILVRRGYVLNLLPAGRATIICGDGKKRELSPGPQGCPCTKPCTPKVCGLRYDGTTIAATRGPDTDTGEFPVVVSPRKTMLGNLRPTIRWTPIAGAKPGTTYAVTVYGEGMKVVWTREAVSATTLSYPAAESPLTPGKTYKVVVITDGRSSQEDRSPGLGFTTLTEEQARTMADEEVKRRELGLPERQTRFLIASLYAAGELYAEAIERLEGLQATTKEPSVVSMLGDLYSVIGLNREAEKRYLEALSLTPPDELDGVASIQKNLAHVYENLGIFDRAIARLRETIKTYRRLGNTALVYELRREERRLRSTNDLYQSYRLKKQRGQVPLPNL